MRPRAPLATTRRSSAIDAVDQEIDQRAQVHFLPQRHDDHDREHERVDRQEYDRGDRRHHPGQEGHGHQRDAEAGEPHDEAGDEDDEGADRPGESQRVILCGGPRKGGPGERTDYDEVRA